MARNRHYLLEIKNIIAVHQAVGTHEGQATNEVLPPVHFTVDTVDPWAHPVVTFPIPERISLSFPWLMEWRPIRGHQKFLCENNYTKHNTVIPGPILEISANIENLKDTGTEIHQISIQLTYSTVEGKWVVENDSYCRSSRVIISIASAIPDVLLLMEKFNTCPGTWYAAPDMVSAIFSVPSQKDHQKQWAFSWLIQQYTLPTLPQGYISFSIICYKLVYRDLHHLTICSKVKSWFLLF